MSSQILDQLPLLSVFCDTDAASVRHRLGLAIGKDLRTAQDGFRAARNTHQSIYRIRRHVGYREAVGTTLWVMLLDWDPSVDGVDQAELLDAS